MTATDPISVACDECASWYPNLPICNDPECGCSECERSRSEAEERSAPFARRVNTAKAAGIRYVVAAL
jgi:hypothetical protein